MANFWEGEVQKMWIQLRQLFIAPFNKNDFKHNDAWDAGCTIEKWLFLKNLLNSWVEDLL